MVGKTVGVLALQGDFEAHAKVLTTLGCAYKYVRTRVDLSEVDGLIIPGGESTTMTLGIERERLADPLREFAAAGKPVLGTCAGLIMMDSAHLGFMDMTARRNAFGRQLQSFRATIDVAALGAQQLRAVFIRAPWVERWGAEVEVLAALQGHPVVVRQGNLLATSFHRNCRCAAFHRWLIENK